MYRGELWWANLPNPVGSEPGYRRPVLVIQDDTFIQSRISTVIVVIITSNIQLAKAPGNYSYLLMYQVCQEILLQISLKFLRSIRRSCLNVLGRYQTICKRR